MHYMYSHDPGTEPSIFLLPDSAAIHVFLPLLACNQQSNFKRCVAIPTIIVMACMNGVM